MIKQGSFLTLKFLQFCLTLPNVLPASLCQLVNNDSHYASEYAIIVARTEKMRRSVCRNMSMVTQ